MRQLCGGLFALTRQLAPTLSEFFLALTVEQDAVLCAVQLQRSLADEVLVLTQFSIQFIDATVQPLLFRFQLRERLGLLRFHFGEFRKSQGESLGLELQPARLAREHYAKQGSHLLANLDISPRFRRLALERCQLFLDFHKDIVDAREIDLGGLELGLGKALFGFVFRNSGGFVDDRAAIRGLGTQNLSDASLFDDGVRIRPEANTHEEFLYIAQPSSAAIDEIVALARAVQPAANYDFTGPCRRSLSRARLSGGFIAGKSGGSTFDLYRGGFGGFRRLSEGGQPFACVRGNLAGTRGCLRFAEYAPRRLCQFGVDES